MSLKKKAMRFTHTSYLLDEGFPILVRAAFFLALLEGVAVYFVSGL